MYNRYLISDRYCDDIYILERFIFIGGNFGGSKLVLFRV